MKTSSKGIRWLTLGEDRRLKAYYDSRGIWTIGIGHTGLVRGKPIDATTTITDAECDALYAADLGTAEAAVNASLVQRKVSQETFDALVSFVFNIGIGNWKISAAKQHLENPSAPMVAVAGALFGFTKAGNDLYILAERRGREALLVARNIYVGHDWKVIP